jgi:hypothetical protein
MCKLAFNLDVILKMVFNILQSHRFDKNTRSTGIEKSKENMVNIGCGSVNPDFRAGWTAGKGNIIEIPDKKGSSRNLILQYEQL